MDGASTPAPSASFVDTSWLRTTTDADMESLQLEKRSEWLHSWNVRFVSVEPAAEGRPPTLRWAGGATNGALELSAETTCTLEGNRAVNRAPDASPVLVVRSRERTVYFRGVASEAGSSARLAEWHRSVCAAITSHACAVDAKLASAASATQRSVALAALVSAHATGPAWPEGPPIGIRRTEYAELEAFMRMAEAMQEEPHAPAAASPRPPRGGPISLSDMAAREHLSPRPQDLSRSSSRSSAAVGRRSLRDGPAAARAAAEGEPTLSPLPPRAPAPPGDAF